MGLEMADFSSDTGRASIATTLLKKVFLIYIICAALITVFHLYLEYQRVKQGVIEELDIIHSTFAKPLGIALWDADKEQIGSLVEGLVASNYVLGVSISEAEGGHIVKSGTTIDDLEPGTVDDGYGARISGVGNQQDLFGFKYPISYSESTAPHHLGYVSLFTSEFIIFDKIKYQLFYILLTASIKACILWFGFLWYGKRLLTQPLTRLAERASEVSTDNLQPIDVSFGDNNRNEVTDLLYAFNRMVDNLKKGVLIQKRLYSELNSYKVNLEQLVDERTEELQSSNKALHEQIRERKEAEATANRYGRILEKSLNEIYVFDSESYAFLLVNEGARCNLGYSEQELKGLTIHDILPGFSKADIEESLQPLVNGQEERLVFNSAHQRKDSSTYVVESHLQLMRFAEQTVFVGIVLDVSDKRILEEQLRQSQKMEAIGTLAGGVAHDFNNLLMGVQGRASLVADDPNITDQNQIHITEIEKYVDKAKSLTQQLLGIARGGQYNPQPTSLEDLVADSASMFGRTRKDIRIVNMSDKHDVVVYVDRQQIEHVLLNIFLNAWQAMSSGGEIQLRTEMLFLEESETKAYSQPSGFYGKISITDNGSGIEASILNQIFNPFFTTKERGRGTGLGLASAYGIIKNHNGFIVAESEVGVGTTFSIYLPVSEKAVVLEELPEADCEQGEGVVLLIDDEQMILDVAGAMLEVLDYTVITAQGGEQGLEVLKDQDGEVDLVILDLVMPGLGGSETFERIRAKYPEKPILISSGYAMDSEAKSLLRKGKSSFIQKPFGMSALSRTVQEAMQMDSSHTDSRLVE